MFNISNHDINYLENYILEFGIKGYVLTKEFKKNNKEDALGCITYDLERLNRIRKNVVDSINEFSTDIKEKIDVKGKIEVIYNHLVKNGIIEKYIKEITETEEESIKQADLKHQVIETIYEIFDSHYAKILDRNGLL